MQVRKIKIKEHITHAMYDLVLKTTMEILRFRHMLPWYNSTFPIIKHCLEAALKEGWTDEILAMFRMVDLVARNKSFSLHISSNSKISQSRALEEIQEQLIKHAIAERFIIDEMFAIDATHIEARDQAPTK